MNSVRYRLLSVATFIFMVVSTVGPVVYADPADTPGVWREWVPDRVDKSGRRIASEPSERELQEMFADLGAIAELFRATSTLSRPVGFDVKGARTIHLGVPESSLGVDAPARSSLDLYFYPYIERRDGTVTASETEWTGIIGVYANDPAPWLLMGLGMRSLEGERWYLEPEPVRTVAGFTMYEQVADDRIRRRGPQRFVVMASPELPPLWLPVTVEEYANDQIRRWEAQLARYRERMEQFRLPTMSETHRMAREGMKESMQELMRLMPEKKEELQSQLDEALQEMDAAMGDAAEADRQLSEDERRMREAAERQQAELEESIGAMKASLAGMSPAERRAQAEGKLNLHRPGVEAEGEIVPPTAEGGSEARGLVRVNQQFFGRSRSPEAMQLLFVSFYTHRESMARRFREIERELDWDALADMIE